MKRKTKIPVQFEVEYEIHPLKQFQADGHFVPAIRERDAQGNETRQPRKWKGSQVHALTMFCPSTGKQILRALSDSREDAERILAASVEGMFWGVQSALANRTFNADQARRVKDERDRMAAWMLEHHPTEFARVLGIAEAAVAEYQAQEKSPALKKRIAEMLNGGQL